jgi:hypothetical protein
MSVFPQRIRSFPLSSGAAAVVSAGVLVQGPLLAYAAQLEGALLRNVLVFCAAAAALSYFYLRLPRRTLAGTHTVAMLALGNVGMLLGWMADFGWAPVVRDGVCLCGCPDSSLGAGLINQLSAMHGGMLVASIPALFLVQPDVRQRRGLAGHWGTWTFHGFFSMAWMVVGMGLAAWWVKDVNIVEPHQHAVFSFAVMTSGMAAAMLMSCGAFTYLLEKLYLSGTRESDALPQSTRNTLGGNSV